MDASGNAIAVWSQSDSSGRRSIWNNRYTVGTGWGAASLVPAGEAGDIDGSLIAMDPSGNVTAVWPQRDASKTLNIWANRYVAGTGWEAATLIETDNLDAQSPRVAMDVNGNAIALWSQFDGVRYNIWSNRCTAATGWSGATLIETDDAGNAGSPQVATDAGGNAIAVWSQFDGARYNIWANRYTAGTGWGTATLIESGDASAYSPQLAMDASGNAIAIWYHVVGSHGDIWANRFTPSTGWGAPTLIETDDELSAQTPEVAMDASGNAIAAWRQSDSSARINIWASSFR